MSKDNLFDNISDDNDEIIEVENSYFEGINSYVVSYSVGNIIQLIEDNIIDLQPEFQRNFIWDRKRASKLIDSLLSNLPIPNVFLGRSRKSEKIIVIDGQQRLKTIYFFINGCFNEEEKPFRLEGLIDKRWNRKSFVELDPSIQRKIKNSIINSTILDNIDFKPGVFFELFYRLNTGGVPLTEQEIRNCIFSGDFNNKLKEINEIFYWKKLIEGKNFNKRMTDLELILRFYSLYNEKYLNYKPPMREWLNSTYWEEKSNDFKDYDYFYSLFERTTKKVYDEIGKDAFKGESKVFKKAIFDAIMISIARGIENRSIKEDLKTNYQLLLEDPNFKSNITEVTNSPHQIISRINLARRYFLNEYV
jgi:hypothetical protein